MGKNEELSKKSSSIVISRSFLLFFIPFLVFFLSVLPVVYSFVVVVSFLNFYNFFHILFLCLLLCIGIFVFLILEVLISGFVVKIFKIKYEEGEYNVTLCDKNVFKFTLFYSIYFFPLNLVELFGFIYLKTVFLKLVGLKIGKNSVLGSKGVFISDPCLTEIGSGTRIGSFSTFTSHVIEGKRMFIKKIRVGNNCLIGGETSLLPGVVVEDNVVLGAKSLVLKNQVLKNGRVYGGIPARELKPSKDIIKRN